MKALSPPNVECELSYAYLHAVASKAGMACSGVSRHEDNNGVDARLVAWGPFPQGGYLTEVDLKVQLKATIKSPTDDGMHLSYWLDEVRRYEDLREETVSVPRILVVLFLPDDAARWLSHSAERLVLRRCAYWVSLRGAAPATTSSGVNIKVPKAQLFSPEGLTDLASRISRREVPQYEAP